MVFLFDFYGGLMPYTEALKSPTMSTQLVATIEGNFG